MMKNMRRNVRALSPIFATLILIAIAVIAGIVVYMFTSGALAGYTGGGSAGQEKVAIQALSGNATSPSFVTLYAQSTGGGSVVLDSAIVKDSQGSVKEVITATSIDDNDAATATDVPTIDAELTRLDVTLTDGTMAAGESYTVTLVTQIGGSFVSQSFKAVGVTP